MSDQPSIHYGAGKRVLLVDRELWSREGMAAELGRDGCDVCAVRSAGEAIVALREERPDVVVMDMDFPEVADHEAGAAWSDFLVLEWLQKQRSGNLPYIILSSAGPKHRNKALEAGATEFLQKPVEHTVLLAAIDSAAERCAAKCV
jgi:CheY-like chemotaxis protein